MKNEQSQQEIKVREYEKFIPFNLHYTNPSVSEVQQVRKIIVRLLVVLLCWNEVVEERRWVPLRIGEWTKKRREEKDNVRSGESREGFAYLTEE